MDEILKLQDRLAFVRDQLSQYAGTKKVLSDSTFVLCPFHNEKTPSLRTFHGASTRVPGWFKCYGCGETGSWNKLAPLIGLKPFSRQKPESAYAKPIPEDKEGDLDAAFTLHPLPKNKVWRGIPTNFLRSIGAKIYKSEWGYRFVYLPVIVGDETRGFIRARFRKDTNPNKKEQRPSYLNSKGEWAKTHGLFPFHRSIEMVKKSKTKTVVLVEGPRDALTLILKGIPAMAILGTHNWTPQKQRLLEIFGVRRCIVCMDGDSAGKSAEELLMETLPTMFKVKAIRCPDDQDPATVDDKFIQRLHRMTR